jgi:DNA repair protein RecO (recombination protein O)
MFFSTDAIVLQLYRYKDRNAIIKIYSRHSGLISCWVSSLRGKTSATKAGLLQPFSLISVVVSHKDAHNLHKLKEAQLGKPTNGITGSMEKSAVALFLAELVVHLVKEASPDDFLFDFMENSILLLDKTNERCSAFHLSFMLKMMEHSGLFPKGGFSVSTPYLDLEEGSFCTKIPLHPHFLEPAESEIFSRLGSLPLEMFHSITIPSSCRKKLLYGILNYFTIHSGMTQLKSHLVFEEVF